MKKNNNEENKGRKYAIKKEAWRIPHQKEKILQRVISNEENRNKKIFNSTECLLHKDKQGTAESLNICSCHFEPEEIEDLRKWGASWGRAFHALPMNTKSKFTTLLKIGGETFRTVLDLDQPENFVQNKKSEGIGTIRSDLAFTGSGDKKESYKRTLGSKEMTAELPGGSHIDVIAMLVEMEEELVLGSSFLKEYKAQYDEDKDAFELTLMNGSKEFLRRLEDYSNEPEIILSGFGEGELRPQSLFSVEMTVNGTDSPVTIDSGASRSFIHKEFVDISKLRPALCKVTVANDGQLNVLGVCKVSLKTEDFDEEHDFLVHDHNSSPTMVLIGNDFNERFKTTIDFQENVFQLQGKEWRITLPRLETAEQEQEDWMVTVTEETKEKEEKSTEDFKICSTLTPEEKQKLKQLLNKYEDVFMKPGEPLRTTNVLKVPIQLQEGKGPIFLQNYSQNPALRTAAREVIQGMIDEGVLEHAPHSNYRIPWMLVEKGVNSDTKKMQYRLVLSAKKLNECLARINFSPPTIPHVLSQLKGKNRFSTLDLSSSFHQLEIALESRHILTIQHEGKLLRYKKCPQGLSISSQYLSYALTQALQGLIDQKCVHYVDDTILFSEGDFDNHLEALEAVLQAYRKANFGLNKNKCRFGFERISFLGYLVDGNGYTADPAKFKELEKLLEATNRTKAKSIFHYFSHYRQFIQDFQKISKPILDAADPNQQFKWGEEEREAARKLYEALMMQVVLMHFDPERDTILSCDASTTYGVGAVLYQRCPTSKKFKPVSIYSRQFPKSQRNSSAPDAELLALYYSLQRYKMELHAVPYFIIESDSNGLQFLDSLQHPSSRQARVQMYLTQFHGKYKIKYKPSKQQHCADFHSRNPDQLESYNSREEEWDAWKFADEEACRPDIFHKDERASIEVIDKTEDTSLTKQHLERRQATDNTQVLNVVTRARAAQEKKEESDSDVERVVRPGVTIVNRLTWHGIVAKIQQKDEECQKLIKEVQEGGSFDYEMIGDLLCKTATNKNKLIFVPKALRKQVLENCHDSVEGTHAGVRKTQYLVSKGYWWPKMKEDVQDYVASCTLCKKFKPKLTKAGFLQPIKASEPFQKLAIDFLDIGRSKQGSNYILVLTDLFSNFVWAEPTKRCRAKDAANAFRRLLPKICVPEVVICDAGSHFTGAEFQQFLQDMGVQEVSVIAPDAHFSNGAAEAAAKKINNAIKFYCENNVNQWEDLLHIIMGSVNGSVQAHGKSPQEILFGVEKKPPGSLSQPIYEGSDALLLFLQKREKIREEASQRRESLQDAQKRLYDRNRINEEYKEGEEVYYAVKPKTKFNYPEKLQVKFRLGRIVSRESPVTYLIEPLEGRKIMTKAHVALMKKSVARPEHLK